MGEEKLTGGRRIGNKHLSLRFHRSELCLAAQPGQRCELLFGRQGLGGVLFQGRLLRHRQRFAAQRTCAPGLVVLAKHRPGTALRVVGEEKPVAVTARQVHRRVAPGLCRARALRIAGFTVGAIGIGQPEAGNALLAALQHAVQGWQVLAVLDGVACTAQNLLNRVIRQRFQPELLDLLELLGVGVRRVVLVVVVQPEQGENLIDRLDVAIAGGSAAGVSRPRRCR